VISGQDAEAAGVDRKALVEAVFGTEVRDQRLVLLDRPLRQVLVVVGQRLRIALQVFGIAGRGIQRLLADAAEHQPRIGLRLSPQRLVEILEQGARGAMPAVGKVAREFGQAGERWRNHR